MTEAGRVLLVAALRRRMRRRLAIAGGLLFMGAAFQLVAWTGVREQRVGASLIFGVVWLGPMLLVVRDALRKGPRVVDSLEKALCWTYLQVTVSDGVFTDAGRVLWATLGLGLLDGRHVRVAIPRAEAEPLYQALAAEHRHACVGWSVDAERAFRRDPQSLLR